MTERIIAHTVQLYGLSDDVQRLITELGSETGYDNEELLLRALTLFRSAYRDEKAGNTLVVVDAEDNILREIVHISVPMAAASAN